MILADVRSITLRDTVGVTGSGRHSVFSVNATKLLGTFATEREAPGMCENLASSADLDRRKIVLLIKIVVKKFNRYSLIDILLIVTLNIYIMLLQKIILQRSCCFNICISYCLIFFSPKKLLEKRLHQLKIKIMYTTQ